MPDSKTLRFRHCWQQVFTTLLQMRNIGFSNNDVSLKNIVTSTAMMSPSSDLMLVDFGSAERADKVNTSVSDKK